MELSRTDRRLLAELQEDANRNQSELAELVGMSRTSCWRRIRDLEERGVLGKHVRLVDPAALGRSMDAFCQVRMKSQDAAARTEFQRAMELEPTITEIYSTSGEWDYLLHLLVRDMADFEAILMKRVLEQKNVAATATTFALRRIKHSNEVPT